MSDFGNRFTRLCAAIEREDLVEIRQILCNDKFRKHFVNKNFYGGLSWSWSWSPLHTAAFQGNKDVIKLLVEEFGICIDSRQEMGGCSVTPLHRAIYGHQSETVQQLLDYGANVNLGGRRWNYAKFKDAIHFAEMVNRPKEGRILVEHRSQEKK